MRYLMLTLHPAIDRVIEVERWVPGGTFDGRLKLTVPSGKGINTARALRGLLAQKDRTQIHAAAWVGRGEAEWFREKLKREAIAFQAIPRTCATRSATTFLEANGRETHVKELMPEPSLEECESLVYGCLNFPKSKVAALCGSAPPDTLHGWLDIVVETVREQASWVIADTNGPLLEAAGRAGLAGLKGNAAEIGAWLGLKSPVHPGNKAHMKALRNAVQIENRKSKIENAPRSILITLGAHGAVLATAKGLWLAQPPRFPKRMIQSATGCGDAATAGWMWGLAEGCSPAECLRRAVACGTAKLASADPGGLDGTLARKLLRATRATLLP